MATVPTMASQRSSRKDPWDNQEYICKITLGHLLNHSTTRLITSMLIVINMAMILFDNMKPMKELASVVDNLVLVTLVTEVLLHWYTGFRLYWKDPWNIFHFILVAILVLGSQVPVLNNPSLFRFLRMLRMLQVFQQIRETANSMQIIYEVFRDLLAMTEMSLMFMLGLSVLGILLFSDFIPHFFGDMMKTLHVLFVSITETDLLDMFEEFPSVDIEAALHSPAQGLFQSTEGPLPLVQPIPVAYSEGMSISKIEMIIFLYTVVFWTCEMVDMILFVMIKCLREQLDVGGEEGQEPGPEPGDDSDNVDPQLSLMVSGDRASRGSLQHVVTSSDEQVEMSEEDLQEINFLLTSSQENIMEYWELRKELDTLVEVMGSMHLSQHKRHKLIQKQLLSTQPLFDTTSEARCKGIVSSLTPQEVAFLPRRPLEDVNDSDQSHGFFSLELQEQNIKQNEEDKEEVEVVVGKEEEEEETEEEEELLKGKNPTAQWF